MSVSECNGNLFDNSDNMWLYLWSVYSTVLAIFIDKKSEVYAMKNKVKLPVLYLVLFR